MIALRLYDRPSVRGACRENGQIFFTAVLCAAFLATFFFGRVGAQVLHRRSQPRRIRGSTAPTRHENHWLAFDPSPDPHQPRAVPRRLRYTQCGFRDGSGISASPPFSPPLVFRTGPTPFSPP